MRDRSWISWSCTVLALAALVALLAPQSPAGEPRLVARIDEPFEVNGTVFQSGTVSLRQVGAFTPTSTLNEVCVDNDCLGLLLARSTAPAGVADDDALLFERGSGGRLVLVGFDYRGHGRASLLPTTGSRGSASP